MDYKGSGSGDRQTNTGNCFDGGQRTWKSNGWIRKPNG